MEDGALKFPKLLLSNMASSANHLPSPVEESKMKRYISGFDACFNTFCQGTNSISNYSQNTIYERINFNHSYIYNDNTQFNLKNVKTSIYPIFI